MDDETAMAFALDQARAALEHADVPVGAVMVLEGRVVGTGRNRRTLGGDPLGHAELEALQEAASTLDTWRFDGAQLYVTLEPCAMCAGAALQARVSEIVFGAHDPKAGACGSLYNLPADPRMPFNTTVRSGIGAEAASELLRGFFRSRRGPTG